MKVYTQTARKDHGPCGRCRETIKKGEKYYQWNPYHGAARKNCFRHYPKASELTSSDKLSRIYAAQETVQEAITGWESVEAVRNIASTITEQAEELRSVGEEYEESASNIEQYFPGGEKVDECRKKSEACSTAADEWDEASGQITDLCDTFESEHPEVEEVEEPIEPEEPPMYASEEVWLAYAKEKADYEKSKEAYDESVSALDDWQNEFENLKSEVEGVAEGLEVNMP